MESNTLYRLTGSGITLRKIKRIMLHATYTDRYSAYIRRKQLLPPFDEIFQISLVRSCVKVRLLVFGFLSKNAAKILLFSEICKYLDQKIRFILFVSPKLPQIFQKLNKKRQKEQPRILARLLGNVIRTQSMFISLFLEPLQDPSPFS